MKNYAKAIRPSAPRQKISWRRRLVNWLTANEADNDIGLGIQLHETRGIDRSDGTVTFTVHPASGGYVIESSYYDDRKDRHERKLHIITSQEDFSEELGKAVFMDILRNR
jgi:hypothetical protein